MNRQPAAQSAAFPNPARPAFTLIELLVVMVVIGLVISIIIPAIGSARDIARATGTRGMLENILQASTQFQNEHRRLPGYFTAREMGDPANADQHGMSAMENILLDLMGGVVDDNASGDGIVTVGPGSKTIKVNVNLMGSQAGSNKAYLTLSGKHLAPQTRDQNQQWGDRGHTDDAGEDQLSDVVDEFGTPVLAWVADETAMGTIDEADDFAYRDSSRRARFYWASNAAFLKASNTGKKNVDQAAESRLGESLIDDHAESLMAVLGNPAYPQRDPNNSTAVPDLAAAPRGKLILHSAGTDGRYFGKDDRGAKLFSANGPMLYKRNFAGVDGTPYAEPDDVLKHFDDLVVSGGN